MEGSILMFTARRSCVKKDFVNPQYHQNHCLLVFCNLIDEEFLRNGVSFSHVSPFLYAEMSPELASYLVEIIFKTLFIYDDLHSRKAVEAIIVKGLKETTFMKSFAASLVQTMEKQAKANSHAGCCKLIKWSCILLSQSQFATISKNAVSRVAASQASLLTIVMRRSFRERRACKQLFFHLFSEVLSQPTISTSFFLGFIGLPFNYI